MDLRAGLYPRLSRWQVGAVTSIFAASFDWTAHQFQGVRKFRGLEHITVTLWGTSNFEMKRKDLERRLSQVLTKVLRGEQGKAEFNVVSRADFVKRDVRSDLLAKGRSA